MPILGIYNKNKIYILQMLLASLSILILGVYGRHGPRLPRYHTIAEEVSFHPKPIIPILKHSYEMDHESYQFR